MFICDIGNLTGQEEIPELYAIIAFLWMFCLWQTFYRIIFRMQCLSIVFFKNPQKKFGCKFLLIYLFSFNISYSVPASPNAGQHIKLLNR